MKYPAFSLVKQHFTTTPIDDVAAAVRTELHNLRLSDRIFPGHTVAITVGSRGIANIKIVLSTLVEELKGIGAKPFLVPSMGSHGGATADGQVKLLAGYGITEENIGAPVISDMAVIELGRSELGLPVYLDKMAYSAEHIIVMNRVKPHTDFEAPVESGIIKMMTIGLGKQKGAEQYHNAVLEHGYYKILMAHARIIMKKAPVTMGIGLVENQLDQTQIIKAVWAEDIEETEVALQQISKTLLPRIPFKEIDLLIVDEMGKDISGTCMDQNVIARTVIRVGTAPREPKIRRIFVRDLTEKSQGMATGIGNADFTTTRLVSKIDRNATYINCLSACEPEMAAIPPYYDSDREILDQALKTIGLIEPEEARVVHIRNTLDLSYMWISEALLAEARTVKALEILSDTQPLQLSGEGNIIAKWPA
ncbi:lactate racemase domain-containing protein [Desulfopila inferna]|uniref:lactate racemase domain-containing protein n=1 Tax=Desulfopila inferna TaxID=468528 RepID=UPI001966B860|nr:lactate racemase domain-containing protein [Desulfopila inferna]MBM9604498.1 DUF2088 domain-containing protein [Desulfopila inferna]